MTHAIPFTQYLRPYGRTKEISIHVDEETGKKAQKIIDAGFAFESEVLMTGEVSLTIVDLNLEEDVAIEVVENGPKVISATKEMVHRFAENLNEPDNE